MQDMPEAALVAPQAYLLTTQPEPGDPREIMHQAAIKGLGLIRDKLKQKSLEKETTRHEQKEKKKPMVPILTNPKIQFTQQEKLQGTKGQHKEHHHTG
jgi:hypothetical protein